MSRPILLIVSVDTEEDNWEPRRDGVTIENIRELPRLDALCRRLGVRATYFTAYQVAIREWAAAILRELRAGGAEIGAHLHPWNTAPLAEPLLPRNSMLKNLPPALQLAKLERLTATLRDAVGVQPRAFRAGRYGLGPDTVVALIRCGYQIDSSVTPCLSPFVADPAAVERLYRAIASYMENLARTTSLRFVTISEAAAQLREAEPADQHVTRSAPASPR